MGATRCSLTWITLILSAVARAAHLNDHQAKKHGYSLLTESRSSNTRITSLKGKQLEVRHAAWSLISFERSCENLRHGWRMLAENSGLTIIVLAVLAFGASTCAGQQAAALTGEQIRQLIQQVAEKDRENDKKQRDYIYLERDEEDRLDRKGHVTSTEVKTYDVMDLYGDQVHRLIRKNDKPLSDQDSRKEEGKIQKLIEKRKNESEKDRAKRQQKVEKDREEGRQFMSEVADGFDFRFEGTEQLDGRETYVIAAEPRPSFRPHLSEAGFLPKFRFRAWIDKDELQWKRADIQCIDTVSFGLILARLHKGSRIVIEQTRVNDEVWLPQRITLKVDARLGLVKGFNIEEDDTFRDYKKFRSESKLLVAPDLSAR